MITTDPTRCPDETSRPASRDGQTCGDQNAEGPWYVAITLNVRRNSVKTQRAHFRAPRSRNACQQQPSITSLDDAIHGVGSKLELERRVYEYLS